MTKTKTPFAFVVTRSKIRGIVTATDILRLATKEEKKSITPLPTIIIPLTISGLRDEDPYIQAVVREQMSTEAAKLAKLIPIQSIFVHVDRYHREGRKTKYALRARMLTEKGDFFAHAWSWDITKAMREVLGKLEREILTKKEKRNARRR